MTRGNQREEARAKAQKKQAAANKGKNDSGMSLAQRRQADIDAVKAKQAAKDAAKAAEGAVKK
ncbi:hypothetical protein FA09DRAFT_335773 [Tilletiopsis washingtonensis]|uniref:Small EDRK-rich factor-like N-terminal domain-containing protein n=1 Tax=Tilletiopsis washingtonensis TaxID=58919 RepID=A0A316ZJ49_9BASI|nr:hypothetical protein FA09DRAFT_335773 [Tilletiopsis washingtonensis]PWO01139.1 hypothetical protein FA09DRAFT_335773 [Tilletiopsis washingtonensis]